VKRYRSSGATSRSVNSSARAPASGATTRSTWISKSRAQIVASTPSPVAARICERLRDCGFARAEETKLTKLGWPGAAEDAAHRFAFERDGPQALELGRRSGATRRPPSPRARGRDRVRYPPARERSHLRESSPASARLPRSRHRDAPAVRRTRGRCRRSEHAAPSSSRSPTPVARATSSTVRSSCVGPRPPETTQRSACIPSANAPASSSSRSPTIEIRAGLDPTAQELGGQKGTVQIRPVAADELACR